MSTQTEVSVKVTIVTIPELVSKIESGEKAAAKADARFLDYASLIRKEADRRDWNEMHASLSLKQAFVKAETGWDVTLAKEGTSKNAKITIDIPKDADFTIAQVQTLLTHQNSDVSKTLRLAYPVSDDASKALTECLEHNKTIADYRRRIGVNTLLDVARGKTTLAKLLNPEVPAAPATATPAAAPATAAPAQAATTISSEGEKTTVGAPQGGGPLSVPDRFTAAIGACKADGLTYPEALRLLNEAYGKAN